MYDTQFVAKRIKERAKKCGIKTGDMLTDLGLGVNTISHLSKGQEMSYLTFAKIADYLDCTVDYLLGRTDTPNPENEKDVDLIFALSHEDREFIMRQVRLLALKAS